jgi:hypothetical protein
LEGSGADIGIAATNVKNDDDNDDEDEKDDAVN